MGDAVQTEGHALLKAVSQGKLRLARLLLEGGAYINEGNERGETALSAACSYGDAHMRARMVRYLLMQGADPNMADTGGRTALMHAVHQRAGVHVISLLLKHGADPGLKDYSGESALTRALLHALRDEHHRDDVLQAHREEHRADHVLDQDHSTNWNSITSNRTSINASENPTPSDPCTQASDQDPDQASDRTSLQLLLEACERRGQQVIILTCCSQGAHRTIRQFHHSPPERHHCPPERNHLRLPRGEAHKVLEVPAAAEGHTENTSSSDPPGTAPSQDALIQDRPQISVNGLFPEPAPACSATCDLAASPSDVHVAGTHEEGVFSFNLAPPRPRPPRVLKRLNSEPWGLSVPKTPALPPTQDEEEVQKQPPLAIRHQRRHSIETHDSALSNALMLTERLSLTAEQRAEPPGVIQDSEGPASDDDPLLSFRRRGNLSSSENLSSSSSPSTTRGGRQGTGFLERRGSGTLLLDHLSQPRPFLPPLFNPHLRSANPAPCGSGPAPRRKKLLRRHSMQPEQMKLLSTFQHVLQEEK